MMDDELYQRTGIALVMLWGFMLKLVAHGHKIDKDNGPDVPFRFWDLWANSMKWRIVGSLLLTGGLAYIAPYAGFVTLADYVVWGGIPIGHLGVAAVGYLGDDLFLMTDSVASRVMAYIHTKVSLGKE